MTWWQAVILGIIEGLTEYLPVSSTGHLLIAQQLMGLDHGPASNKAAADAYAICIQAGAIVAVLGLYARRVRQMTLGLAGRDAEGRALVTNIFAGFIPAAVIGLLLNETIKAYLFGPWTVVAAWFAGGLAILIVDYIKRRGGNGERGGFDIEQLTWRAALIIGFAQCIAMWPGVSRSLVTIVAGLLVGMNIVAAVEFSFLLGVVTLGAATAYDAVKHGDLIIEKYGYLSPLLGFVFAFIAAVIAVKWMVAYLQRHSLMIFGWYRIGIALVVAVYLLTVTASG